MSGAAIRRKEHGALFPYRVGAPFCDGVIFKFIRIDLKLNRFIMKIRITESRLRGMIREAIEDMMYSDEVESIMMEMEDIMGAFGLSSVSEDYAEEALELIRSGNYDRSEAIATVLADKADYMRDAYRDEKFESIVRSSVRRALRESSGGDFVLKSMDIDGDDVYGDFVSEYGDSFGSKYEFRAALDGYLERYGDEVLDLDLASEFDEDGDEIFINTRKVTVHANGGYNDICYDNGGEVIDLD